MKFDPDTIRARFHELSAKASKLHEEMDPLREELADIVAGRSELSLSAAREREAEIRAKVKAMQPEFGRIEAERATCARALGGRTGPLQADAAHLAKGSSMAAAAGFIVTDLVWYHDTDNPTDPDPAPGVVTAVTGDDYTVEITLADSSTQTEKHVGPVGPEPSPRWIEPRDRDAGDLGG